MANIGAPEILVVVVVIALVFGWKKLPDAARSLGRSMRIFKSEVNEMKKENNDTPAKPAVEQITTGSASQAPTVTTDVQEKQA